MDELYEADKYLSYGQFNRDVLPHLTSLDISKLSERKPTLFKTFTTTLRNKSAKLGTKPLTLSVVTDPRIGRIIEGSGRSRFFTTKIPPYSPDTVSMLQETMIRETLNQERESNILIGNTARITAHISRRDVPNYRAFTMNLHSFRTFLTDLNILQGKVQHDLSFLVVAPNQLLAYPTILPLFRNYGLQLLEPHYMLTAYLSQHKKPIYFFKNQKTYMYSTQSYYTSTQFIEKQYYKILNDQTKLCQGYIMSGLGYVFSHSHERGYQLLRSAVSNHHRPDYVVYVYIPEDVIEQIPRLTAFDPSTNYTILLYNYDQLKRSKILQKYFEGRILKNDRIPKSAPFCFTTEFGNVNFCTLLEWKTVKPKTIMLFTAANMINDEGVVMFEQAGIAPDLIILFDFDNYDFSFDIGNYLYERFYVSFFTRSFPVKTFSVYCQPVTLEDNVKWTRILPNIPYYQCKHDRIPSITQQNLLRRKKEAGNEWHLSVPWSNQPYRRTSAYYGLHREYYRKHVEAPVPSLQRLKKQTETRFNKLSDKLNLKDVEGRIEYFQNLKKLPLKMRNAPENKDWGRICPVTTLDEAMLFRGHYTYPLKIGTTTYMMKSRAAIYKFLYNPMYRQLQWAWWSNSHILVCGQPFCGARYVATALALILKAPHIYYDPIYKAALKIKRIHNHCYYLESCWMAIVHYKWDIYTDHEISRFKRFLPWALRTVKIARALVVKGMDEATINHELRFRCFFPFYKQSRGQLTYVFPRLEFEFPELLPKFFSWADGIVEGYLRILDLIILYVLNVECPPLFLARIIYQSPDHLLPDKFEIEHPNEMFFIANIMYEHRYRMAEVPKALEESRLLCQTIFQAMAKRGTVKGEGWVISGVRVYPNLMQRLSESGVSHKIIYITDPTFNVFHQAYVGDTRDQTIQLAKHFSFITRYVCPHDLKNCRREMVKKMKAQMKPQVSLYPLEGRSAGKCSFLRRENIGPLKCLCTDLSVMHQRLNVCKKIKLPLAMKMKGLVVKDHAPIWEMLENTTVFLGGELSCSKDHPKLHFHDHLPVKINALKRPRWKYTYCRRYAFDYFYKHSSKPKRLYVETEMRQLRPRKFVEMVTEIAVDNMKSLENCHCRLLCLCKPISFEEFARFS
ncbi:hypothetical protein GE061_000877 [Apolygus lucorum]|uniref:Uncharacterized protein n=1 Tax=Apolygus lucorum TaxID=248454 RepID=A0A6A4KLC2_APOLU|nr:hypothetical protein GE061_000877 [Apolygus lucorum]